MYDHTGSHTPQQVIPQGRSFRTSAPVGILERLDPTGPGSCHGGNDISVLLRVWWQAHGYTYKLYPDIEIVMVVPLRMGSSVYTFPEVPTIGFVSGRTSSSLGSRSTSGAMVLILKVSYAR